VSILKDIAEKKREGLIISKSRVSLGDLKARIEVMEKPRDFRAAITRGERSIRLIAEIKKASPSKGVIRADFDPVSIARIYEDKAVDAISVLTEEDFFCGDLRYLQNIRKEVTRPILRKDFIFDEYQIYESRANGADAVLLIASLLDGGQAREYLDLCNHLGLSALFEVHSPEEVEKALRINAAIIGINNRDLKTLRVDLNTTFLLKRIIPSDRVLVSESGIKTRDDVMRLDSEGVDAMLVGTTFMESQGIGKKIDELRGI
jgi:indole-3-glycerol phosphate synthase